LQNLSFEIPVNLLKEKNAVFWMLRRVALVEIDVSEERIASESSVLKRTTRHNIREDGILHSHSRETSNLIY
jgi:hypothetical protein